MAGDFDVEGTEQLRILGLKLKVADRQIRLGMGSGIRRATKPLVNDLRKSAKETLPKAGGLNEKVAHSTIGTRVATAGPRIGVFVRGKNSISIRTMNSGKVRHPLFGNRAFWYTQEIEPGWWSNATHNPEVLERVKVEIELVLKETAKELSA